MSGFCGWFGENKGLEQGPMLAKMMAALPHHGKVEEQRMCGTNFALGICGERTTGSLAARNNIVAVMEGYPEWTDSSLQGMARAQGNASALIAAFERKGTTLFETLHGPFSFAIIDLAAKKLLCAIDRFGIHTLCFAGSGGELTVFGSTTDAVRAHPNVDPTISLQSIFSYLYFVDRIPAPLTIYKAQCKLPAAHYLYSDRGSVVVDHYWQMPYRSRFTADKHEATRELNDRLREAVKISVAGENKDLVGAFLSGGLDSSTVVGLTTELFQQSLKTFTIGFPIDNFDETRYAEIVAKRFSTAHHVYNLQPKDVLEIFSYAAKAYDEPFANSSLVPAYHCALLAKNAGVELMLAGDGGDELFAGNKRYAEDAVFDHYKRIPSFVRHSILDPILDRDFAVGNGGILGKIARYARKAKWSVPERVNDNLFLSLELNQVFTTNALCEIDAEAPLSLARSIYDGPADADKVQRMMQLDLRLTLADCDIRKVSRTCEFAGVRVRFPFLNDKLAEFSAHLPQAVLMEKRMLRKFYKDAMRGFLPDAIINKEKHGFGLPYVTFMNSHAPLRELLCDSLRRLSKRGYFHAQFLDTIIDRAHAGNLLGHETVAWDLVILDLWLGAH